MDERIKLVQDEDLAWAEIAALMGRLTREQVEEPGLTLEGWSVKDLLWHLGCWWAEAGRMFQRMRAGTYESSEDWGTDEKNARFLEEGRRLDLATVKTELYSARNRAILEFTTLPQVTSDSVEWFEESGTLHYRDHAEDLRAWVEKLTSGG